MWGDQLLAIGYWLLADAKPPAAPYSSLLTPYSCSTPTVGVRGQARIKRTHEAGPEALWRLRRVHRWRGVRKVASDQRRARPRKGDEVLLRTLLAPRYGNHGEFCAKRSSGRNGLGFSLISNQECGLLGAGGDHCMATCYRLGAGTDRFRATSYRLTANGQPREDR